MDVAVAAKSPVVLPADEVAALPVEPLGHLEGIGNQVLWRDASSMAGVLTIEAGHHLGAHTHRVNHHHVWVLDGRATILDEELDPGSYVHIPAGVEHDMSASDDGPCRIFYLYLEPPG